MYSYVKMAKGCSQYVSDAERLIVCYVCTSLADGVSDARYGWGMVFSH